MLLDQVNLLSTKRQDYHVEAGRNRQSNVVVRIHPRRASSQIYPNDLLFHKFVTATKKGNLVPMFKRIFSDHLTPILAYRCLVKEDDRLASSSLFECLVENGQSVDVGRFSIVGAKPSIEIIAKDDHITVLNHKSGTRVEKTSEDPMSEPGKIAENWQPAPVKAYQKTSSLVVGSDIFHTTRFATRRRSCLSLKARTMTATFLTSILVSTMVILEHGQDCQRL